MPRADKDIHQGNTPHPVNKSANKKVKIKDLAKELGVTSRRIINHCRHEGWPVQNSLTKLDPALERAIRASFHHNADDGNSVV